jgi:hypothetical protein
MSTLKFFLANGLLRRRNGALLLAMLYQLAFGFFVPGAVFSQNLVQRDHQALAILTQTIEAGGGSQLLASIQDVTETGTITYYGANSSNVHGSVIVKGRGLHQFKIEAELSTGKRTIVANGYGGLRIEADGRKLPIHGPSAVDLGSLTIPYLPLIAAMQDPSVSILYSGIVDHNNASVYDLRLQRAYTRQQDPQGDRGRRELHDVYIDPKTLLIAAVADHLYLGGPKQPGLVHEDLYSDYQPKNGIMLPLTITQTNGGEVGFTMNLEEVTINANLTDAEFSW